MDKNKLQTAIDKCQHLLKFFTEKREDKFEAIKVVDSDELVDYGAELIVGADVSISTPTGSVPATDGDYSLVNGAVFTVKDGKVESIAKDAESKAEEVKQEDEKLAEEAVVETKSDDVKALEDKVSKLEELVKALTEAVGLVPSKEDVSEFRSELQTVNESIKVLSKIPTQLSSDNRVEVKDLENDKYKRIAALYSK